MHFADTCRYGVKAGRNVDVLQGLHQSCRLLAELQRGWRKHSLIPPTGTAS